MNEHNYRDAIPAKQPGVRKNVWLKTAIFLQCAFMFYVVIGISYVGQHVHAQRLVPPPPVEAVADGSFTANDRKILETTFLYTQAIYQKMFPQLNDGTRILIPSH